MSPVASQKPVRNSKVDKVYDAGVFEPNENVCWLNVIVNIAQFVQNFETLDLKRIIQKR